MRLVLAVVVSVISVLPIYGIVGILSGEWGNNLWWPSLVAALAISFVGVIVVGLPVHFFLRTLEKQRGCFYAAAGFLTPFLLVMLTHAFGADGRLWIVWQSVLLGAFGALIALIFWRIAVSHEPPKEM